MAQRKSTTSRKYADRDVILVMMSTGYRLIIERPTLGEIEALNKKAEELFPAPPRPTEKVTLVTGEEQEVPLGDDHPRVKEWQEQLQKVQNKRGEYVVQYALNNITTVEGFEDDEGREKLISTFADRMERLMEFGALPDSVEGLNDYAKVIRLFVIADAADFSAVVFAITSASNTEVDEEVIREKMRFFPGQVART